MEKRPYKFCDVCGRRIPELSMRRRTCSNLCSMRRKNGYAPYKDYTKPPFEDITVIQKKAQEKGLSYGMYMASLKNITR